jgi:hypothetical protein
VGARLLGSKLKVGGEEVGGGGEERLDLSLEETEAPGGKGPEAEGYCGEH